MSRQVIDATWFSSKLVGVTADTKEDCGVISKRFSSLAVSPKIVRNDSRIATNAGTKSGPLAHIRSEVLYL